MSRSWIQLIDGVEVPMSQEEIDAILAAEEAEANRPPVPTDVIAAMVALITQGQAAMVSDPLPNDIQEQIYDLEVFVANYIRRNAYKIAKNKINAFEIPVERLDVTSEQRALVAGLKTQMLDLIP